LLSQQVNKFFRESFHHVELFKGLEKNRRNVTPAIFDVSVRPVVLRPPLVEYIDPIIAKNENSDMFILTYMLSVE
jgi:hypothetical protein